VRVIRLIAPFVAYTVAFFLAVLVIGLWAWVAGLALLLLAYRSAARACRFEIRYFWEMFAGAIIARLAVVTVGDVDAGVTALWILVEVVAVSGIFAPTLGIVVLAIAVAGALALAGEWWLLYWMEDRYGPVLFRVAGEYGEVVIMAIVLAIDLLRNLGQLGAACWLKKRRTSTAA